MNLILLFSSFVVCNAFIPAFNSCFRNTRICHKLKCSSNENEDEYFYYDPRNVTETLIQPLGIRVVINPNNFEQPFNESELENSNNKTYIDEKSRSICCIHFLQFLHLYIVTNLFCVHFP